MNYTGPPPVRASALAAMASIFSSRRHVALAVPHNLAAELQSKQIADAYRVGQFPKAGWQGEAEALASLDLAKLRRTLLNTCLIAAALAIVALAIAAGAGKVHPTLEADYGKVVTWIGGTFAAWAGLLQLSPVRQTFRGSMLHEVAYSAFVRSFAALGILLAAIGALWWQ